MGCWLNFVPGIVVCLVRTLEGHKVKIPLYYHIDVLMLHTVPPVFLKLEVCSIAHFRFAGSCIFPFSYHYKMVNALQLQFWDYCLCEFAYQIMNMNMSA